MPSKSEFPTEAPQVERILVVTGDHDTADLVVHQALAGQPYRVHWVATAGEAIEEIVHFVPDLILISLRLPDLSAKDLLAALQAQQREIPVVVMASREDVQAILQAFRLGALDYLPLPARETEVIAVVDRALQQVRERKERRFLAQRLEQTNRVLEQRVAELSRLFQLAKTLTASQHPQVLFRRMVEETAAGVQADRAWLVMRHDRERLFHLVAHVALPKAWVEHHAQAWDDGLTPLVALSGEPLNLHGEPLSRFPAARLGKAIVVAPVRVKDQTVAVLGVARKDLRPFTRADQDFTQAVADLAAVAIVNLRLFQALEAQAQRFQQQAQTAQDHLQAQEKALAALRENLFTPLRVAQDYTEKLAQEQSGPLTPKQREALQIIAEQLQRMSEYLQS